MAPPARHRINRSAADRNRGAIAELRAFARRPETRLMVTAWSHASEIAAAVADDTTSAAAVVDAALARIATYDTVLNAFTAVVEARARGNAKAIDAARAANRPLGPLAGVPFAVKNLFDVAGLPSSPAPRSIATARRRRATPP